MTSDHSTSKQGQHCPKMDDLLRYHADELPEQDLAVIDAHILECALCIEALEALDRSQLSATDNQMQAQQFKANFEAALDEIETAETPTIPLTPAPRTTVNWLKIAAVLVPLISISTVGYFMLPNNTDPFPKDQLFSSSSLTLRGEQEQKMDAPFATAVEQYDKEQYEVAIEQFEALSTDHPLEELKLLYLGNAYLATGSAQQAIQTFEQLLANENWILYRHRAEQYLEAAQAMKEER